MTRRKQYKKHVPSVLPPTPRTGAEPGSSAAPAAAADARPPEPEPESASAAPAATPAAPVLPTPRVPGPEARAEPAPVPAPEPVPAAAPTTADFVREMRQRAGDVPQETVEKEVERGAGQQAAEEETGADTRPQDLEEDAADGSRRRVPALALAGVLVAGFAAGALAYWWVAHDDGLGNPEGAWTAPAALEPGEGHVETRVHADGTMEVRQWVRADEPLDRLTLRVPRVSSAGRLAADRVEVLADGEPISGREEISYFNATYDLGGATEVEVRYRLVGAVQRSDSAAGRALAVATGLEARFSPAPAREVRVVKAPEVLSLACTPAADVSPVPCGEPDGDRAWRVDLTGRRITERVVASVTLR